MLEEAAMANATSSTGVTFEHKLNTHDCGTTRLLPPRRAEVSSRRSPSSILKKTLKLCFASANVLAAVPLDEIWTTQLVVLSATS